MSTSQDHIDWYVSRTKMAHTALVEAFPDVKRENLLMAAVHIACTYSISVDLETMVSAIDHIEGRT